MVAAWQKNKNDLASGRAFGLLVLLSVLPQTGDSFSPLMNLLVAGYLSSSVFSDWREAVRIGSKVRARNVGAAVGPALLGWLVFFLIDGVLLVIMAFLGAG
ncbi:MAG: hypothetical protein OHK0031_06390 [Anaerolineales bacterium]